VFAWQPSFRVHPPSRATARVHPLLRVTARVDFQRGLCVRALLQRLNSDSEEGKRLRSGKTASAPKKTLHLGRIGARNCPDGRFFAPEPAQSSTSAALASLARKSLVGRV